MSSTRPPPYINRTTLARHAFPSKPYVCLENPSEREFAMSDPIGFLGRFPAGAVIDEVQRVPDLMSWIQGIVDEQSVMGQFVLTGSQQFDLVAGITQSLAGRAGRLELLALSVAELNASGYLADDLETNLFRGGYPATVEGSGPLHVPSICGHVRGKVGPIAQPHGPGI